MFYEFEWSGRRDSNPRHPPWQGGALPTELRPHLTSSYLCILLISGQLENVKLGWIKH